MIPKLRWDPCLDTGIEEIDWEHRRLLNIANRLLDAMGKGRAEMVMQPVLRDLIHHAEDHFANEEKYMRDMGYPGLKEHMVEHGQMRRSLDTFVAALASDQPPGAKDLAALMSHWLLDHILKTDKQYAAFSRERLGKDGC